MQKINDWKIVTTQAEFDAAIDAREQRIEIAAKVAIDARIPDGLTVTIKTVAGALVRLFSGHVVARESSHVVARESSRVEAWGSSRVEARGSSRVEARGSSRVVARWSSRVVARESSRVEAWGSSRVEARESSHVVARESSHVEAFASAALSLFGLGVKGKASSQVGVHLHDGAKCEGGVQIAVVKPRTIQEWCDWYGAKIEGEYAVLYKGVNAKFVSSRGSDYTPGTWTVAADWDGGKIECGLGLHFSPCVSATLQFATDAERFVECLVPLAEIAVHPDGQYPQKVKALRCWNRCEVDHCGERIGKASKPPAQDPA